MRRELESSIDCQQRRLLEHALYSTYWDCATLDMRDDAQEILGMPRSMSA
jgi:hypothetical protein